MSTPIPSTPATPDTPVDHTSIPHTWRTALSETPPAYRSALLRYTRSQVDPLGQSGSPLPGSLGHDIAVEFTGLAKLQYSAFIPFHLIPGAEQPELVALMATHGPTAVLNRIQARASAAKTALIIGDASPTATFDTNLDRVRDEFLLGRLVAGPGPDIEAALRRYAAARDIPRAFVSTIDTGRGATWSSTPGPMLDALITELFEQYPPDYVIVFEPTRLPSTLFALDKARHLGIPVRNIDIARG